MTIFAKMSCTRPAAQEKNHTGSCPDVLWVLSEHDQGLLPRAENSGGSPLWGHRVIRGEPEKPARPPALPPARLPTHPVSGNRTLFAVSAGESPPARIAAEARQQPASFGNAAANGSIGFGAPAASLGNRISRIPGIQSPICGAAVCGICLRTIRFHTPPHAS